MLIYLTKMARQEGFEPPTARFVAEYSIQLSYGRVLRLAILSNIAACETDYFIYFTGISLYFSPSRTLYPVPGHEKSLVATR